MRGHWFEVKMSKKEKKKRGKIVLRSLLYSKSQSSEGARRSNSESCSLLLLQLHSEAEREREKEATLAEGIKEEEMGRWRGTMRTQGGRFCLKVSSPLPQEAESGKRGDRSTLIELRQKKKKRAD